MPVLALLLVVAPPAPPDKLLEKAAGEHWRARWDAVEALAALPPQRLWDKRPPLAVRALFLYSAASPRSGHVHRERILKALPNAMIVPIRNARALPYVEFNEEFHRAIDVFLK